MTKRITTLLTGSLIVLLSTLSIAATQDDEIRERIRPAGSVCVVGDACAGGLAVAGGAGGARDAASIYQTSCVACHSTGVSESPILGNVEQWAPRISKGIDVLYTSTINGFNTVMPARGTCINCSDDELRAVVDYMVSQSQ